MFSARKSRCCLCCLSSASQRLRICSKIGAGLHRISASTTRRVESTTGELRCLIYRLTTRQSYCPSNCIGASPIIRLITYELASTVAKKCRRGFFVRGGTGRMRKLLIDNFDFLCNRLACKLILRDHMRNVMAWHSRRPWIMEINYELWQSWANDNNQHLITVQKGDKRIDLRSECLVEYSDESRTEVAGS